MRRTHRRDGTQAAIIAAFERLGASVLSLADVGRGAPDLAVGYRGVTHLIEVKADNAYGKRGLTARQQQWADGWRGGPVRVVSSEADVVAFADEEYTA